MTKSEDKNQYLFSDKLKKATTDHIKTLKKLHALTSSDIAERLQEYDMHITPGNLNVKLSTGEMSSNLFIAILLAMNEEHLDLETFKSIHDK